MAKKPFVFIGSSSEGLEVAKGIQANLEFSCECQIWSQGLFGLSGNTLETLVKCFDKFDYAILVLTEDDITISRNQQQKSPRDNVIFELGLFIGGLGLERTFIVIDRNTSLKLPTDLGGVTTSTFETPIKGTIQSALGSACLLIEQSIKKLGIRNQLGVTAHWWKKCNLDGISESPNLYLTVFNRTNSDLPWLNVHIFPSNNFKLTLITEKYDRIMSGQYAIFEFKMFDDIDSKKLNEWSELFSKENELSVRIFKENSVEEAILISYELGAFLLNNIMQHTN